MNTPHDSANIDITRPSTGVVASAAPTESNASPNGNQTGTTGTERPKADTRDPSSAGGWQRTFASLTKHRYFRMLWLGTLGSFAAMQMQQVARGNLGYDLARDTSPELAATLLGLVSVSMALPMLLFSVVGGVAADRWSKRNIVITSQAVMCILAVAVAALVYLNQIAIWHLAVVGLVQGVAFAFNGPARQSLLPQLTGHADMSNGIALNNAGMSATRVAGPALAGMLIAVPFVGFGGVFLLIAACYVWALFLLLRIPANYRADDGETTADSRWKRNHRNGDQEGSPGEGIFSGFRYIKASPVLIMAMIMGTIPTLVAMPVATLLMPVFARHLLGDSYSSGLGLMFTASGVGALVGSFFIASLAGVKRQTGIQLIVGLVWGVSLCGLALAIQTASFPLVLVALAISGFAGSAFGVLNQTLVFASTDPALFGRIMGVYMMTFSLFPLASLPAGFVADMIGAPLTAAAAGIIVSVFIVAVAVLNPTFRKLETDTAASLNLGAGARE